MTNERWWKSVFEGEGTDLIPAGEAGIQKFDDDAFKLATKTGDWLSRLQLMTANSEKCKKNEFPVNHYALVDGKNYTDLGEAVDLLLVTWRPKAIEIGDEIVTVYDPKNPEFERIQLASEDSDSGCMFGPEFLVWVPSQKVFATYFMGSKSARREATGVKSLLRKAATLKSHLIETKKYSWFSPCVTPCSTPFDTPDMDGLKEEVNKFNNPPATEIEKVKEGEGTASRDR